MTLPGLSNPLLDRRSRPHARLAGVIKERPEDFLVDEIPLIEPSGQGEHLHLGVQKRGVTHDELVRVRFASGLEITHPQAAGLRAALQGQFSDPRVTIRLGPYPGFRATFDTPNGPRVLT